MNNYIHYTVSDEITYLFPNFNTAAIEVWEWISNFIPHFTGHACDYFSILGMKLIHVSNSKLQVHTLLSMHVITYPYWEWS